MEILANIGWIVAAVAIGYVICMFLRWFFGIQNLESKLDQVLEELQELKNNQPRK